MGKLMKFFWSKQERLRALSAAMMQQVKWKWFSFEPQTSWTIHNTYSKTNITKHSYALKIDTMRLVTEAEQLDTICVHVTETIYYF